jgi:hypothetical protein
LGGRDNSEADGGGDGDQGPEDASEGTRHGSVYDRAPVPELSLSLLILIRRRTLR